MSLTLEGKFLITGPRGKSRGKSFGIIFPTASAHSVSLCHIAVISDLFVVIIPVTVICDL